MNNIVVIPQLSLLWITFFSRLDRQVYNIYVEPLHTQTHKTHHNTQASICVDKRKVFMAIHIGTLIPTLEWETDRPYETTHRRSRTNLMKTPLHVELQSKWIQRAGKPLDHSRTHNRQDINGFESFHFTSQMHTRVRAFPSISFSGCRSGNQNQISIDAYQILGTRFLSYLHFKHC